MRAVGHAVGGAGCVQGRCHLLAREAEIEHDVPGAAIEAVEVGVEKKQCALVESQAFPNAIAEDEAGVENRDFRLVFRDERTVEPDLEVGVARVCGEVLAAGHER